MFNRIILALTVAGVAYASPAPAQENATLLLRSGASVRGELVDMGGVGFTIRVNGEERRIPTDDVAVIDFTGNPSDIDWAKITPGEVVLRNGQRVKGTLYDIGGTVPLRITLRTDAGERDLQSSEVGRIVMARPNAAAVPTTGTTSPTGGGSIVVPANLQWVATGLTVREGESLTFNTTGEIRLSTDQNDLAGPAGARSRRLAPNSPLPRNFAGALIGRIGPNGQPFAIGDQTSVPMPGAGVLYLGINDDVVTDNDGEYRVEIQRSSVQQRRRR